MEKTSREVEIEGEIGRILVENGSRLVPKHQPKERIYSLSQQELSLMIGASLSYHNGQALLNRLQHRDANSVIKFRTYRDYCERTGKRLEEHLEKETRDTLSKYHFDIETGKPSEELAADLRESGRAYENNKTIDIAIEAINADRPQEERIKTSTWQIERKDQTCYISMDDIGVKHQKEHRIGNDEKNGAYVWNTVAHIETENVSHTVTGVGMKKTLMFVLAYLLKRDLLAGKTLVFFTDGAKSIFANIGEMFSFHPYTVVLDWFHLKKRCQEYLSMSVKGKEKRNVILQKLLRILWVGNVDEAIAYLQDLGTDVLREKNRIEDLCQYIEKHREHIPPYALRAKLGLRNSSNRVEKANDIVVAHRQKHNGMSWSTSGSGALAQVSAFISNDELHSWLNEAFSSVYNSKAA